MSAFIVSSGRSSISQWPVFGNVIDLACAAINFTCFPNASPLALLASDRENGHCSSRMTRYPYELHNLTRARRPLKAAILRYPIASSEALLVGFLTLGKRVSIPARKVA